LGIRSRPLTFPSSNPKVSVLKNEAHFEVRFTPRGDKVKVGEEDGEDETSLLRLLVEDREEVACDEIVIAV